MMAAAGSPSRRTNRGFDAVVIGEPQRAFCDNQYGNTMPVFRRYGVPILGAGTGGGS